MGGLPISWSSALRLLLALLLPAAITAACITLPAEKGLWPITLALVYVGTTLKDLSDTTHDWNHISTMRWVILASGIVLSVALMMCVTKVAKSSLEKALMENEVGVNDVEPSSQLPVSVNLSVDLYQPFIIKIDPSID